MNILFFLTPKSEVAYIYEDYTMRQTLEKMEYHRYSAIPIIDKDGKYVGTITEGDLLWTLKNEFYLDLKSIEDVPVASVKRRMDNTPVSVNANIEDLISKSMNQNFVPVIDDQKTFIGIIKRRDIIDYCYKKICAQEINEKENRIYKEA
ncbi:MAG: CBS domain-containing protein [Romboutsia sp.]